MLESCHDGKIRARYLFCSTALREKHLFLHTPFSLFSDADFDRKRIRMTGTLLHPDRGTYPVSAFSDWRKMAETLTTCLTIFRKKKPGTRAA